MLATAFHPNATTEVGRVTLEGKTFDALGYTQTAARLTAYLGKDGVLTKWDGTPIGRYRITDTWKTPRSWVSSTMSQVYVTLADGTRWTGRSAGVGMLFTGKPTQR